jgi:gliding motility-associated-like protein
MKKLILIITLLTTLHSYAQIADFMASSTTLCAGGSITFTNLSSGATSYAWTFIDGASSQTSTLTNPVITYSTPGNYAVILTASNSTTSDTEIKTGYITVIPAATISLTSGVGSDNQNICANSPFTISYAITGATGATLSLSPLTIGISSIFTPSPSGGTLVISGNPSSSFNFTINTTGGSCIQASANGNISIIPAPILSLTSASSSANQTICLNSSISTINYSFGGSATGVSITGLPTNVFYASTSSSASISGAPSTVGVFNYLVVTTGGSCPPDSLSGQIIIDTSNVLILQSPINTANQTVCINDSITPIIYVIAGSATGVIVTGLPTGMSGNFSNGFFTITGSSNTISTNNYTVTTTGGACNAISLTGSITISPSPTLSLSSSLLSDSQSICINNSISNIVYSFGGSTTNVTATGLPNGINVAIFSNNVTLSGIPIQSGFYTYTISTLSNYCSPVSLTGSIYVESPIINLISPAYTNNQLICMNSPVDTIQYLISGIVTTYDLPIGTNTSITAGTPDTLSIFGLPSLAGSYFYTIQSAGLCGNSIVVGNVTVLDSIINNTIGNDTTVCQGSLFQFTGTNFTNSGITAYNYSWENAPSATGPWTPAPGINNLTGYSNNATLSVTEPFFRRVVTNGSCIDSSNVVQLTIDTIPSANNAISNYNICSNDTVNVTGLTITNSIINSWSTTGSGVLQNIGGTTPLYIPSISDAGTTVLLTYEVISNNACAPQMLTGTITINVAAIPIALAGASATVCANGTEINIPGSQALNGLITWTSSGNGTLSDTTILSPTYTTSLADTGDTILFTMIVTDTNCTVPLSDTAQFQLFVDPIGINPSINAFAGDDVTIGLGDSIQLEAVGVAITTWDWSPGLHLSDSTIYNPFASPIDTTAYILTVYDINGCIDTDTLTVNVILVNDFFIPNLFSPNGDGSNDFWEIPKLPFYPNTLVTIINREGMEVYRNDNYDNSWDGKYKGKDLPDATYYYYLKLASNDKVYKGAVTILRNK